MNGKAAKHLQEVFSHSLTIRTTNWLKSDSIFSPCVCVCVCVYLLEIFFNTPSKNIGNNYCVMCYNVEVALEIL